MNDDRYDEKKPRRNLRERVETLLHAELSSLPAGEIQALVRELNVRQTELEIQNEALREAQIELAEARDRYADLYDFAPFGYMTLDQEGKILEANLAASTLLGVDRKSLLRMNFSAFATRESAHEFALHLRAVFAGDTPKNCEIELDADEHMPSIIRVESTAVRSQDRRYCRTAMIDISYRKAAERIVHDSEERLRRLNETLEKRVAERTQEVRLLAEAISHLGEGVLITKDRLDWPGPEIVFVNDAMCRISGYSAEEMIGRSPRILQGADTEAEVLARIRADLSAGRSCAAELINYRKGGTPYHAELFITPLRDVHGRRTNFVSIHRDITERKQAEDALRQSYDLLGQRVHARTRELEEANKACETLNAAKTRFLTAASHDLRQPLQSVELYLSALSQRLGRSEDLNICDKMRKSLDSMNELLNALLDISRFESGTITPSKQDFPLQPLLDRIVTDNQQQAEEKGLELNSTRIDCIVHSDPALLERVIENFVTNAIRYTDRGRITINCEYTEKVAKITVRDTGIGIRHEALEPIFNEYFQLDNPMRDRRKGLGLGLSIVKHIARLLEHRLSVDSEPDQGSAFTVEVPLGKSPKNSGSQRHSLTAEPLADHAPAVVLFIDDDCAIISAMTMLLEAAQFKVCSAANGDQALARLAAGIRPDIVVCDYRLPDYDGIEVIRRVRKAAGETLPAILLTGDTSIRESESEASGDYKVLLKPVASDQLISWIEHLTAN